MKRFKKSLLVFALSLTTMLSLCMSNNYGITTQIYAEDILEETNENYDADVPGEDVESEEMESTEPEQEESQEQIDDGISTEADTDEGIATYSASSGTATADGVTYQCNFNEDGTATITKVVSAESDITDFVFPEKVVSEDGQEYSVTEIKEEFEGAIVSSESLRKSITSLTIPGTIKTCKGQFTNLEALKTVTFEDGVEELGTRLFMNATSLENVTLSKDITSIPSVIFNGCTSLRSVKTNGTITSIGENAFNGCASLTDIPDLSQVTEMGNYAFYNCQNLKVEIDLSSLTKIPNNAFCYDKQTTIAKLSDNLTSIDYNGLAYTIIKGDENDTFVLPETLTSIGNYAFYKSTLPSKLVIPDSVTSMGTGPFWLAKNVTTITIGSGLTNIPSNAFSNITSLKEIIVDNSEDDINGKENFPSGVKITYLRESVGDVGDTISPNSDKTLQQAVDEAEDGEVITIEKNIKLNSTLNIPSGKNITIQSSDGNTYTILGNKDKSLVDLINVESGATVSFANVTLSGQYNSESVINSAGNVTLSSDSSVKYGKGVFNKGVINVTDGSFTLDGGAIQNNNINNQKSGAVRASSGTVTINSGEIKNNKVTDSNSFNSSAGVLLTGNATGTMTGGSISSNTAYRGAAIMVYNVDSGTETASFEQSGGTISNNTCTNAAGGLQGGGAVHVEGYASYTLSDKGTISGNTGVKGGGVTVVDPGIQNGSQENGTAFIMNGGTISSNSASHGGGIYSYSNSVVLNAGTISENSASQMGGGVYSEGNEAGYSTIHMSNTLVSTNKAEQGGGLWFCPTGNGQVYATNGAGIYDNSATGAGDDTVVARSGNEYSTHLDSYLLGGGKVDWYRDGDVTCNGLKLTAVNSNVPRYVNDPNPTLVETANITDNIATKAIVTDSAKSLAQAAATLFITGNSAKYGGGIGANGGVAIGENETTEISVTKAWSDNDNQDGKRPTSITVKLLANNEDTGATVELNVDNNWQASFTNLPTKANGKSITYTVEEVDVDGYKASVTGDATTGYTITNSHTPEKTKISVTKAWADNENQDGKRPTSITVKLLANGNETGKTVVLNSDNKWKASFTDLDKYANGEVIQYTVTEDEVGGYTTETTGDMEKGFTITNTHTPESTEISVTKAWSDNENQDGKRPTSITVKLLADGKETDKTVELNADNNWQASFTGLDKYANGKEISYTVEEVEVDGYTPSITGDATTGYTVTNSHTPEKTKISVTKAWADNDNQDGKRPTSITVKLLANGNETGKTVVLNSDNKWQASFTDLDKYANGEVIQYTVKEDTVSEYDEPSITGDMESGFTITNTHTPETTEISVTKAWSDNENQDGKRPTSITVKLLADGKETDKTVELNADNNWQASFTGLDKYANGKEISYTVEEVSVDGYTPSITGDATTGYTVTNSHTPEKISITGTKTWDDNDNQDGKRPTSITVRLKANGEEVASQEVTPDENDNWTYTFENLDKYANGEEIVYTVTEDEVTGYDAEVNGTDIKNTHTPEKISITGTKTWNDNDNQDGKRPTSITVRLKANGEEVASQEVTPDENGNWSYTFENLDRYANGKEITYTITEDAVDNYTTIYSEEGYGITNKHTPDQTSLTVTKVWSDSDNKDGIRPDSVTVKLLADGKETDKTVTLNADNKWTAVFDELDMYSNGKKIEYTIEEVKVDGYTSKITGDATSGYTITNTHEPTTPKDKEKPKSDTKTGVSSHLIQFSLLADVSLAGAVLMLLKKRK